MQERQRSSKGLPTGPNYGPSLPNNIPPSTPCTPGATLGKRAPGLPPSEAEKKREGKKSEDGAFPGAKYLVESAIGAPHFNHQLLHLLDSPAGAWSPPPRGGLRALEAQPQRYRTPPGSSAAVTATACARRWLTTRSEAAPHRK